MQGHERRSRIQRKAQIRREMYSSVEIVDRKRKQIDAVGRKGGRRKERERAKTGLLDKTNLEKIRRRWKGRDVDGDGDVDYKLL